MLFQRLAVAHQPRFTRWSVDRDGDTGDLPVALAYQVIHGFEGGFLLFEEDAAFAGLAHFTVNDHQRRGDQLISDMIAFSLMCRV